MKPKILRFGRDVLKAGMASAFTDTGLIDLLGAVRRAASGPRIHVLGYHRLVDKVDMGPHAGPVNPSLCISIEAFKKQMEQVRSRFDVLSLAEVMGVLDGRFVLERDACAITFDDGYADVFLRARPILAELGLPAALFVPTGYAGGTRYLPHDRLYAAVWSAFDRDLPLTEAPFPPRLMPVVRGALRRALADGPAAAVELLIERLPADSLLTLIDALETLLDGPPELDEGARILTPDELRILADEGWEIGAHTISHVVLTHEPPERVQRELVEPRRLLEAWTGRPCHYLAYCNGYHSPAVVEAARAAGYLGAVTTCDRWNSPGGDPMRVGRKCLWEGHTRGPDGRFSSAVSAAHLHDLFGTFGMTRPVDGEVSTSPDEEVSTPPSEVVP